MILPERIKDLIMIRFSHDFLDHISIKVEFKTLSLSFKKNVYHSLNHLTEIIIQFSSLSATINIQNLHVRVENACYDMYTNELRIPI